jgi:hypothetical protein
MSDCRFEFPLPENIGAWVSRARAAVEQFGGEFDGDDQSGGFAGNAGIGKLRGRYSVTPQSVVVEVTEKPFMVSCSMIEGKIREFFG